MREEPEIIEDVLAVLRTELAGIPNIVNDTATVHSWLQEHVRVEHERGMCSWDDFVDFVRKNSSDRSLKNYAEDYFIVMFRVWGPGWLLFFESIEADPFYSHWKVIPTSPERLESVRPERMDDIVEKILTKN